MELFQTIDRETSQSEVSKTEPLTKYTFEQALEASLRYFQGDNLAAEVWVNKYALKDSDGNIYELSPEDMHRRLAREFARIEQNYPNPLSEEAIFGLFKNFQYIIPQGSPMSGIGNPFQVSSLSNCFVIGSNSDSYGGIMRTDEEQVQLMKRRGGVGHDLSYLRPKGSPVKNSALTSTGIVPFMERYSNSTREVAQDGRRGALMLSISSRHPDVEDFIDAKMSAGKVTGANVSVRIDDAFMKAVKAGGQYQLQYPVDSTNPKTKKQIDAPALWKKIIHNAWKSAEPGVLFWDTVINESVPDCYSEFGYQTISTNPCGEIPLCPYDSCRLVAINLYSYVKNPFEKKAEFDFKKFSMHVQHAQRLMDDMIDLELEHIDAILEKLESDPENKSIKAVEINLWQKIRKTCKEGRRTGLGITAEGDMLAALGLRYGSDEAIDFSVKVHQELARSAYRSSVDLAKDRGKFTIYDCSLETKNPFIQRLRKLDAKLYDDMQQYGRRNIALLTIAPTGTTSLMCQTSSGIEPAFLISYTRRRKVNPNDKSANVVFVDEVGDSWEEYHVFHHKFENWLEKNGYDLKEVQHLTTEDLNKLIAKSPYHKATANDVDWVQKVKMQGAIQKYIDHSISVTVNVPFDTTEETVAKIYETAWESGCKGCTIYRDGSRSGVLIQNEDKEKKSDAIITQGGDNPFIHHAPKRPKKLDAEIVRFQNNHEKWLAIIGLWNERPYEIFTGLAEDLEALPASVENGWIIKEKDAKGENRYDFQFKDKHGFEVVITGLSRSFNKEYWNYAKLISGILRHGMPLQYVVDLINGLNVDQDNINTWKNGVVRALKKYVPDGTKASKNPCDSCGDPEGMHYKEGCLMCKSCGHTKCG